MSMPDEESGKPAEPVKVSDRRSFTSEGARRNPDQPRSETERPRSAAVPQSPASPPQEARDPGSIDFDSFVRYLAQLALHQMTGARDPATGEVLVSLEEARQTIDILNMLKEKTRGNLDARETKTLDELLYHLKIEYSRRAAAKGR